MSVNVGNGSSIDSPNVEDGVKTDDTLEDEEEGEDIRVEGEDIMILPVPVEVESRLALRLRLAPLVKCSFQVEPSFKDSSVIGTQSEQQGRNGTVWSSGRRWYMGRDGLRGGDTGDTGAEGERWTRQGDNGIVGDVDGERLVLLVDRTKLIIICN